MPIEIESLLENFLTVWSAGQRPSIANFLDRVGAEHRDDLLSRLLPIDIDHRIRAGDSVIADDYAALGSAVVEIAEQNLRELDSQVDNAEAVKQAPSEEMAESIEICRKFRHAWNRDQRPKIFPMLAEVSRNEQIALLGMLLRIELEELEQRGAKPTRWSYYPQFPGFRKVIDDAFQSFEQNETSVTQTTVTSNCAAISSPPQTLAHVESTAVTVDDFERRYHLDERIGSGAFGDVYRATDTELERQVAVKILRVKRESLNQILREARLAAKLRHPAIVTIYDLVRRADGSGCIVMEYVAGSTLSPLLESPDRPISRIIKVLSAVAEGLQHAHMAGLVHRDLKPANILVDSDDQPRIADFGLAVHEIEQRERLVQVAGTPCYMSPEQIRGEMHLLDGRCDIWAVGVMLYEALTGRRPFEGRTSREIFDEINRKSPRPPRMIDNTLPQLTEQICLKCLSKDVSQRYTNAGDLASELKSTYQADTVNSQSDDSAGLLNAVWNMLDPDLQDAFSLAYNKKRRLGKNRISTRDLFQALTRIQDDALINLLHALPAGAMPEPIDSELTAERAVVQEQPLLSDCVRDSLSAFRQTPNLPRKLSPTDLFVDIGQYGHGPSVRQLREHGVTARDLKARVDELGLSVIERSPG